MKSTYLLLSLSLLALTTQAQTTQDSATFSSRQHGLREVTIVAPYRAVDTTPVPFRNIGFRTIEQKNFGQEPTFLLQETPSITTYSDAGSYSGYSYFRLRGIDQTRINTTLNGIPMNEPEDQGAYFNNFPDFLNSVQSVQIQRGVGTSANGVASYAGSLNFESMSLLRKIREVSVGAGSFGTHREYAEYGSGLVNGHALYLRASNIHSDGFKERSMHSGQSLFYSYGFFGKKSLMKLTGYVGNQRNKQAWLGAPLDSLRKNPRYNANSNEQDHFLQAHTQLQYSLPLSANTNLTSAVYYTFQKGNYDFDLNNFLGLPRTAEMYNYAFHYDLLGVNATVSREVRGWKIDAGVHGNLYKRTHTGSEYAIGRLYRNNGRKNEASAFAKTSYDLGQFTLFGDIQARYAEFSYQGTVALPVQTYKFLNPRAGLTYRLNLQSNVYYSIGKTSREPTRNDIFMGNDDLTADAQGNAVYAQLTPESVVDQELGVKFNFGRGHVNGNLFYMDFSNEIVLNGKVGPNGLPLHSAAAQSYRTGFEFDAEYDLTAKLRLVNNSSFSRNRITDNGTSFQPVLSPSVIVNQEVQYRSNNTFLSILGRYQGRSYVDYANDVKLPGFYTLGAQASQQVKNFRFTVRGNNLTNRKYYQNGIIGFNGSPYYFLQAPVNYFASVTYSF